MDMLDSKLSAVEQLMKIYPDETSEKIRMHLGSFGISGNLALRPMYLLSGGQKSRVSFAMITWDKPHIILLDEPTNHLDFDAINAKHKTGRERIQVIRFRIKFKFCKIFAV